MVTWWAARRRRTGISTGREGVGGATRKVQVRAPGSAITGAGWVRSRVARMLRPSSGGVTMAAKTEPVVTIGRPASSWTGRPYRFLSSCAISRGVRQRSNIFMVAALCYQSCRKATVFHPAVNESYAMSHFGRL
ncbi:hypothetical protein DMB37_19820 [Nocardia sp. CS682]|nr:hypothetical protein DMB37_19820 [Nocardia sp. CS682]